METNDEEEEKAVQLPTPVNIFSVYGLFRGDIVRIIDESNR